MSERDFHEYEIMIEAAGSRLYGVTEICLLCMVVRRVILVAIVVMSLFNYIPPLQKKKPMQYCMHIQQCVTISCMLRMAICIIL